MSASRCAFVFAVTVLAVLGLLFDRPVEANVLDRQVLRKLFGCPACESAACPALNPPGCSTVLEPGVCGCCQVCSRAAGQSCGLATGRCRKGLSCRPRPGDPDPLGALLDGTAVCV